VGDAQERVVSMTQRIAELELMLSASTHAAQVTMEMLAK
jgi:hypothetical protein